MFSHLQLRGIPHRKAIHLVGARRRLRRFMIAIRLIVLGIVLHTFGSVAPSTPTVDRTRITRRLHVLLRKEFPPNQPGGVILVALKNKPIFLRAYGLADLELGVPMRPDSVLRIGSITKQFTAVAILRLVQDGKISLDDDVRSYAPPGLGIGPGISIEQVLTHTAGLPNLVDLKDFEKLARHDYEVQQLLALTKDEKQLFPPGEGFRYSDTGYILLGAVIERASGLSYAEYLESRIFKPLGMHGTFYGDDRRILARRATGYSFERGKPINAPYISMTVPHGAGGLVSTVSDLLLWDIGLRSGKLVRRDLLDRAWSARTLPDGTTSGYGFGWKMCTFEGHRTIEHGGWINGFGSRAIRFPDAGLNVIVLVNNDADRPDAGWIARRIAKLVLTGSDKLSEHRLTLAQRESLLGRYQLKQGGWLTISERDGSLYYERSGGRPERLVALSPRTLSFAEGDHTFVLTFGLEADDRAKTVRVELTCEPVATGVRM